MRNKFSVSLFTGEKVKFESGASLDEIRDLFDALNRKLPYANTLFPSVEELDDN